LLFKERFWAGIEDGSITLAFRRWKRPTVRTGGRLLHPAGELAIDAVDLVTEESISEEHARRAGYVSRQALLAELGRYRGTLYRIKFHRLGPDPRVALRGEAELTTEETADIRRRLSVMDRNERWTLRTLQIVKERPATLAAKLAGALGSETPRFKARVRRLKELGLTESLTVGYRLSPRGEALLAKLESDRLAGEREA
jgi:hypothetical protein